jgi:hypothetical protein
LAWEALLISEIWRPHNGVVKDSHILESYFLSFGLGFPSDAGEHSGNPECSFFTFCYNKQIPRNKERLIARGIKVIKKSTETLSKALIWRISGYWPDVGRMQSRECERGAVVFRILSSKYLGRKVENKKCVLCFTAGKVLGRTGFSRDTFRKTISSRTDPNIPASFLGRSCSIIIKANIYIFIYVCTVCT